MKHLKSFEGYGWKLKESLNYKSDLWQQINPQEKKAKLDSVHETFDQNEIVNIKAFVKSLNNLSLEFYVEDYLVHNLIVIKHYMSLYDLCIYKLQDDWYIVSFEVDSLTTPYSVNFLCDQLDAVQELIKTSVTSEGIKIPFDYFQLTTGRDYPYSPKKTPDSLVCAELIRQKIKESNFNIEYDEILPTTNGSSSIRFRKYVEFSDLSQEAIEFFNIRREAGRRIVMIRISFGEYEGDHFLIHFGLGPELSEKHISFECQGVDGVRKLLDDKFSLLG